MVDAAAHLNAPYEPTVGHWPDGQGDPDPWGPRRIDHVFVSRPVAPALVTYRTHKSAASRKGAGRLPVYVDIAPTKVLVKA
ncbi:hypothetical protein [Streptomyces pinistramenti]|uniref:hypothetical protein n=1 Tax=Streptomyces pinistramenti TaxID=2884812 RepID=UPI001D05F63F|nr:hypothetical protein [Streptomyces pinistramenti]MCB5908110.1 hypothetical protein [Streptomyces pinistramenti]